MVIIRYYSSHVVPGLCYWPFWGLFAYLFPLCFFWWIIYSAVKWQQRSLMIAVASGWLPFSFLCNYSLFSLIFNQVSTPSPIISPVTTDTSTKKEKHFSIASGTFSLHSGKAVSFVAVMITVYEGGKEGQRRDQMEKYCGHKYAHTPPTHRTHEPKNTHLSCPIKRLE